MVIIIIPSTPKQEAGVESEMKHIRMKAQAPHIGPHDIGQTVNVLVCLEKGEPLPGEGPGWGTCRGHVAFCPGQVEESPGKQDALFVFPVSLNNFTFSQRLWWWSAVFRITMETNGKLLKY